MDSKSFFKLSYGLYLISSCHDDKQNGCISNTLIQVSSKPAKLSVTLSKDNFTTEIVQKSNKFTATVLTEDVSMDVIGEFGFKTGRDFDKFSKFNAERDVQGIKYLKENMAARFSCKVTASVDVGTHITFIGEAIDAEVLSGNPVMTYAYYHQVKKGVTPKNSPLFKEEVKKSGYRCTVCGYTQESDHLPEGFVCPICGNPEDYFEKL